MLLIFNISAGNVGVKMDVLRTDITRSLNLKIDINPLPNETVNCYKTVSILCFFLS